MSDGSGSSAAKLFKTNVWRLYQSLDLADAPDGVEQVACYSDGVGTSSFRPLAIVGGAFGWGLKRNILQLYEFLCRHWSPGDEIWLFGFSRGAFTVRTLAGMIATVGVLQGVDEQDLPYATRDAYRAYRATRHDDKPNAIPEPFLVRPFRALRDVFLGVWRRMMRQTPFRDRVVTDVERIRFVGVWDTVAAYGTPFAEVTLGIDKFIFQLSMPTRDLNLKVEFGRQALGLDDQRETFHPMPWNEQHVGQDRIKQVWFAGMHADVGGGYPDDAMSVQALLWMMTEAGDKGLRYVPAALERFAPPPSRYAVLHDSRAGMSGYYRYQPRRLCAYLARAERAPDTVLMIDPQLDSEASLRGILLHHSAVARMTDRQSRYAPTGLPRHFSVVTECGDIVPWDETAAARQARLSIQADAWDDIWRKRWVFRLTVVTSLALASLPVWTGSEACNSPSCSLSPLIRALGVVVPSFATWWTEAFANRPGTTVVLVGVLAGLLVRSATLERRVHDRMLGSTAARSPRWVRWLRTSDPSVALVKFWKWRVLPTFYGVLGLVIIAAGVALAPVLTWFRYDVASAEADSRFCGGDPARASDVFSTNALCWPAPGTVEAGKSYRVTLQILEPWLDGTIPAGPAGIDNAAYSWLRGYVGIPAKRSINGRWFQPHVTIRQGNQASVQPLDFYDQGAVFVARLDAARTGQVYLWVNDAVEPRWRQFGSFFRNHKGTAKVSIEELSAASFTP